MAKPIHSMIRVLDEARSVDFYRRALGLRPSGGFDWRDAPEGALAFARDGVTCIVNFTADPIPVDDVVLASDELDGALPRGTAAWVL